MRDLNDELNSLMREKRHWETQIVSLGGANYKRAQASMTDDAGREVPGTRGYKWVLVLCISRFVRPARWDPASRRRVWGELVDCGLVERHTDGIDTLVEQKNYQVSRSFSLVEVSRILTRWVQGMNLHYVHTGS